MHTAPTDTTPHHRECENTMATRLHLTVEDVCEQLDIARSTFDDWRAKGCGPRCIKLPNGKLRIRRPDFDDWINSCLEGAA